MNSELAIFGAFSRSMDSLSWSNPEEIYYRDSIDFLLTTILLKESEEYDTIFAFTLELMEEQIQPTMTLDLSKGVGYGFVYGPFIGKARPFSYPPLSRFRVRVLPGRRKFLYS